MKMTEVTMVRLYLTEGHKQMEPLLKRLHDWEKVRGVTVFRGVTGFGPDGEFHSTRVIDMSLDLPLVIEFFDAPAKVATILEHLKDMFAPGHIVSWSARMNDTSD